MEDLSNLLDMIFQTRSDRTLDALLTNRNLNELEYLRQLILLKSNPDYIEGSDERADALIASSPLTSDFLRGLQCGLLMALALDPLLMPSPHHGLLKDFYEKAHALQLEQDVSL
jgi:hypothetical protein